MPGRQARKESEMAKVVVGLFPDRVSAEHALVDLRASGFDTQRMGIVMRDPGEARETAAGHGVTSAAGAVTGGVIGGTLGAILAATGTLVIPGIGPFISGGILATALAGGAAGWLVGGLIGLGLPREEAQYYQGQVEQGVVLITVDPEGRDEEARQIMLKNGAENLDARPGASAREAMPEREAAQRTTREEPLARDRQVDRGQDELVDRARAEREAEDNTSAPRRPAMDEDIIAEDDVPPRA
jgi:hypothetical protein